MSDLEAAEPAISLQKCHWLHIGSVGIEISPDPGIQLLAPDLLYQKFSGSTADEKSISRIRARLVLGKMPELSRLDELFNTRESWSIHSDPRGLWIRFQAASQADPYWIARFDRQVNQAIVYCGPPLIEATEKKNKLNNPVCYPLDQLLLMYHLAFREGILVHAAGVELNGRGFIFPGCSGAGKSTLTRLFAAERKGNLLSDERIVLRLTGAGWQVYGTPWAGTAGSGSNGFAPLAGIFFLKHDTQNHLRKIMADNALERLMPILSIPWYDHEVTACVIASAKKLTAEVPAYEMSFTPDSSAVDFFLRSQKIFS